MAAHFSLLQLRHLLLFLVFAHSSSVHSDGLTARNNAAASPPCSGGLSARQLSAIQGIGRNVLATEKGSTGDNADVARLTRLRAIVDQLLAATNLATLYAGNNAITDTSPNAGLNLSSCSSAGSPVNACSLANLTAPTSLRKDQIVRFAATVTGYWPPAGRIASKSEKMAQGTPQSPVGGTVTCSLASGTAGRRVASMEYLQTAAVSLSKNVNAYDPAVLVPIVQLLRG